MPSHAHVILGRPAHHGWIAPALVFALCAAASPVLGYDLDTHRALSNVALRHADCIVDAYLKNQLILPDGYLTAVSGGTLASRLEDGAENEDTDTPTRPRNHFFNPITGGGLDDIASGTSSLRWAYDDARNLYDWLGARDAYIRWFTAGSRAQRLDALGYTFYALGHVIHLVQDLAQPQHTRNDAHITYFPGAPYEDYCTAHYNTPLSISSLGSISAPSFAGSPELFGRIPGGFSGFWDTGQYTGQDGFTVFASTPGLAEYSNAYFITDDTMFGTSQTAYLRRPGSPGLEVKLTETPVNSSTAPRHRFANPALINTSLASFFPPSVTKITLQRAGEVLQDLPIARHYVSLLVHDASGALVYAMPNLFLVTDVGEIGFDDVTFDTYASRLLPRAAGYSAGMLNYFFRGQFDTEIHWLEDSQQYRIKITNRSGEVLQNGSWSLYQDDESGARVQIPASFSYSGTLSDSDSFYCDFSATARDGPYTLVFQGTLGDEQELAVVGKSFEIVRVHLTWTPNSDQDLQMWGPDGSRIWWHGKVTQYGELDLDNIGGLGLENITLKDLQPGRYEFLINYYEDYWMESYLDSDTGLCIWAQLPQIAQDDPYNDCFVQTNVTVTMQTFHNSSDPVRTETRTMVYPDFGDGLFNPGNPEGSVGQSWYVTQIVTVDDQRHVTIENGATTATIAAHTPLRVSQGIMARKPNGGRP
ncbi:MAG: hypothetical protein ACRENS_03690 [Candidatus Eiseniibacteriota bacterium]